MFKYLLFLIVLGRGCKSKDPRPELNPDESVSTIPSFKKDIKPIFESKCSPCHAINGKQVNKWINYNTSKTLITGVVGRITRAETDPLLMPQNGPKLTQKEIDLILNWKDNGLLD